MDKATQNRIKIPFTLGLISIFFNVWIYIEIYYYFTRGWWIIPTVGIDVYVFALFSSILGILGVIVYKQDKKFDFSSKDTLIRKIGVFFSRLSPIFAILGAAITVVSPLLEYLFF